MSTVLRLLQSHDDKEKANSPFDTNGLKKDDQVTNTNGVVNGIDDDKGFKWVADQTDQLFYCLSVSLSASLTVSVSSSSLANGIDIRMAMLWAYATARNWFPQGPQQDTFLYCVPAGATGSSREAHCKWS